MSKSNTDVCTTKMANCHNGGVRIPVWGQPFGVHGQHICRWISLSFFAIGHLLTHHGYLPPFCRQTRFFCERLLGLPYLEPCTVNITRGNQTCTDPSRTQSSPHPQAKRLMASLCVCDGYMALVSFYFFLGHNFIFSRIGDGLIPEKHRPRPHSIRPQ
jgi:hypothetical protein